jgi:hypothetical protein
MGILRGTNNMNMTAQRFALLVESYGTESARWPVNEREAAMAFIAEHAWAQSLLEEHRVVDLALDHMAVPAMNAMERRIMIALNEATRDSLFDRAMDWLVPHRQDGMAWAWRPALLACLPLICGIYMANFYSFGIDNAENSWQEELYLISMNDYAEISE